MSLYEDSYKSQLQGVSQQVVRERLESQVASQVNMLSDPVTGLRRRPGLQIAYHAVVGNSSQRLLVLQDVDIGGRRAQVMVNAQDGAIYVFENGVLVAFFPSFFPSPSYLMASAVTSIQFATVAGELYICNTEAKPALSYGGPGRLYINEGFFTIRAGAFNKKYEIALRSSAVTASASYTTPLGTVAGDAALADPAAIASALAALLDSVAGVTATAQGAGVHIVLDVTTSALSVTSPSGASFVGTSGDLLVRQESDLPDTLPPSATGLVVAVGADPGGRYYRYGSGAWAEAGDTISPTGIIRMPFVLGYNGSAYTLDASAWEGRLAGDDVTNPAPDFIAAGITGMSSYQGRLVLLAGNMVNFSASGEGRRFYRSTVTTLLDSDTIRIGAAGATAADFRHAVQFEKDLILVSSKYQAVVPGGNSAITPRTASVVITSEYSTDVTLKPIVAGRTLMYATPRNANFFGLMEMVAAQTADSLYTSTDSTAHLPRYMPGRARFAISSSASNLVVFASTTDKRKLIVHEYTWQGQEKVQQAWHEWRMPFDVVAAYFNGNAINLVFVENNQLVVATLDPRQSRAGTAVRLPYVDLQGDVVVAGRTFTLPLWFTIFDPTAYTKVRLAIKAGEQAGEEIGFSMVGSVPQTVRSFPDGLAIWGYSYLSEVVPNPPIMKDWKGVKVSSNKMTVLRFLISTNTSSPYKLSITDEQSEDASGVDQSPVYMDSPEWELDDPLEGADSTAVVPARTRADSTVLRMWADGLGEFNLVGLEFAARYHEKIQRRRG